MIDWKSTIKLFNEYHKYSDNEYLKYRLKYTHNKVFNRLCLHSMKLLSHFSRIVPSKIVVKDENENLLIKSCILMVKIYLIIF